MKGSQFKFLKILCEPGTQILIAILYFYYIFLNFSLLKFVIVTKIIIKKDNFVDWNYQQPEIVL